MSAPRAGLPSPHASRAVLVGVSEYATLEPLPAVANNVTTLRRVVTDSDLWGLPDGHCTALLNPTSVDEVLDAVHTAASAATDALLFYFAGHGLLDDRSELYLALPGSDKDRLYRAVRYDDIRREVVATARACYGKVVILDCCYSGRALQGGMSESVDLADHARVDGTYLMTASAETSVALAPPGEDYTAFTGALIDKLLHGMPDGPDLLDMETLFFHVRADLQARHFPVPQQRTRNDGKAIALVRNRRASRKRSVRELVEAPLRVLPRPPAGFEALLRRPPSELSSQVAELRAAGDDDTADQLLAASAALRADQEVAAIVGLLGEQQRRTDLEQVLKVASWRPPAEVLRIVDALRDIDLPATAAALLRAAGAGEASDVAGLARLLRTGEHTADMVNLLDAALDTALERSALIGLVNALWVAGLRKEVDGLIRRAVARLSERNIVGLADELREVGREETAFRLYARAARKVAKRPLDVVAQLCLAMSSAGYADESDQVADALVGRADSVIHYRKVMVAFWDTGQDDHADHALRRAAASLSSARVLELAAELRALDRDAAAYQLCERVVLAQPANASHDIIAALRLAGRPIDAKKLLETVAGKTPVTTVASLLGRCTDTDRRRVLEVAMNREPNDVAELLARLDTERPDDARQLMAMAEQAMTDRVELLPVVVGSLKQQAKEEFFVKAITNRGRQEIAELLRGLLPDDASLLVFVAVREGNPTLEAVLSAIDPAEVSDYLVGQPLTRLESLTEGLLRVRHVQAVEMIVDHVAGRDRDDDLTVAKRIALLYRTGQKRVARQVLASALRGRTHAELKAINGALRQQAQPEALAAAARWIRNNHSRIGASNGDDVLRQLGLGEYAGRRFGKGRRG